MERRPLCWPLEGCIPSVDDQEQTEGETAPRAYRTDLKSLARDVKVETYKSSGPGGQKKNKTESAVRLTHIPTGIAVIATEYRSQSRNKELAFLRLQEKLRRLSRRQKTRISTAPSQASILRQKVRKRKLSAKKSLRHPLSEEES
ncbi:MAG: peptide chain release factor-like protein [Chloroflexi bacterium]|nr:peptide chain release factor-like protein [Chloroflexota bacterium]